MAHPHKHDPDALAYAQYADHMRIGYKACWKPHPKFPKRHCRKPKGHKGDCAHY